VGGVASSTLGYVTGTIEDTFTKQQIHPEIEVYQNLSSPAPEVFFYRYYAKGGNVDGEETGWEGPLKVSDGYVPRPASGPKGAVHALYRYRPWRIDRSTVLGDRRAQIQRKRPTPSKRRS
jgi:hypothetical protein